MSLVISYRIVFHNRWWGLVNDLLLTKEGQTEHTSQTFDMAAEKKFKEKKLYYLRREEEFKLKKEERLKRQKRGEE